MDNERVLDGVKLAKFEKTLQEVKYIIGDGNAGASVNDLLELMAEFDEAQKKKIVAKILFEEVVL